MQIFKKFIKFGTGTNEVNSQSIPANFTPANYTPAQVGSEGNDKVSAHLNGIDAALAGVASSPGDISGTSFAAANNQAAAADVTGFAFANATVRSFDALVSVAIDATTDLFESFKLHGIQHGSGWNMSQTVIGQESGFEFTITSLGAIQYTSGNYAGFVSATIKFRAITSSV